MSAKTSLVLALRVMAKEYQAEANTRDLLSDVTALERAAAATLFAAVLVQEDVYTTDVGYAWLSAADRLLTAIQDARSVNA